MGVKAAVVYDVPRHKTVILRTQSVSTTDRYQVLDTISSFSQHCESLRGVARSVTEVSALWGGPPFVNYSVVNNRFRVIIIWDEGAGDLGVTQDVYRALSRLEKAVESVSDALINRIVEAVSRVYEEAGFALSGDYPSDLINETQPQSKGSKFLPPSSAASLSRRSSAAEPKRKKSSSLLGRIGSVIKGAKSEKTEERHRNTPPNTSLREPSESAQLSVANFGSEVGFDDEEGDIELSDEVFAWADFGEPLPEGLGNLDWFEALLRGDQRSKKRPRAPVLRPGRNPKTPLKIPTRSGLQQQHDGLSEGILTNKISDRKASAPGTPPVPSPPTAPGVSTQSSATGTPAPPTPATATSVPSGIPLQSSPTSMIPSAGSIQQSRSSNIPSSVVPSPGSLPHSSQSVPQSLGPAAQSPPVPPPSSTNGSQQNVTVTASPLIARSLPPRPGVATMSIHHDSGTPSEAKSATPQSSMTPSQMPVPAPSPASTIPTALRQSDDFDISGLGGLKDVASVGETQWQEEDETIRAKMNDFAVTMQSGNFRLALQQVIASLRYLAGVNPRRDREIMTCSNYYLAQKILIRNAALEREISGIPGGTPLAVQRHVECALLTMFLAELKHLTPRHRVAAMKVAVEKNSIVGNYGMCARWLRHLVEKAPAGQKADFANRLQICVRNGERNSHMPSTNRLCYNSLQVVTSPYGSCGVCGAMFHPMVGGVVEGQVCGVCFVGVIERKT